MKTKILSLLFLLAAIIPSLAVSVPVIISQWTFESPNTPATLDNSAAQAGILPALGNGTASGVHANAGTDWSTPVGNGSAESWSANNWAVGDYWQFRVQTIGFENISLGWDQASSATGPREFGLFWSTDGTTFSQFGVNYAVLLNPTPSTWNSSTPHPEYSFSLDLTSITALNSASSAYFRLRDMTTVNVGGGAVAAGGTDRIDNFTVSGTAVPESLPFGAEAVVLLIVGIAARRFVTRSQALPAPVPLPRTKRNISR